MYIQNLGTNTDDGSAKNTQVVKIVTNILNIAFNINRSIRGLPVQSSYGETMPPNSYHTSSIRCGLHTVTWETTLVKAVLHWISWWASIIRQILFIIRNDSFLTFPPLCHFFILRLEQKELWLFTRDSSPRLLEWGRGISSSLLFTKNSSTHIHTLADEPTNIIFELVFISSKKICDRNI